MGFDNLRNGNPSTINEASCISGLDSPFQPFCYDSLRPEVEIIHNCCVIGESWIFVQFERWYHCVGD